MNLEKLKRLQSQVRIGGKGTPRRKKKVIHQTAAADDKKLQSSLKKLSVNTIPGIEEVNIIKDDLTVIHFKNPKAQASLSANTFAVTGHGETKKIVEMLPEIMPQLGQETVVQLRMFANSMTNNQKSGPVGDLVTANLVGNMDDDDVPQLVNDFDEIAKRDEISKTELKPRMEVPGNVTVSKTEAPNGEMSNSQKNVSNKGVDSNYTNIAASTTSAPILKSSEIVKGEEKLPKELTSNVNKTDSSGASNKEVGLNKELPDKQKNKTNIEKVQVQEKDSKSPTKDKKPTGTPAGEKPDMKQEKNHQKTTLQKPKPERLDEKQISEDSAQPVDKAVKVPDVTKSEETSSSSQLKEIPVGEITTILPPSPSTTNTLLSEIVKNQIPITQSDKPPVDNVKTPEVVKDVPKSPEVVKQGPKATESNNAVIQAVKPKVEEPLAKTKEDSTPKKIEAILQPEQAPVSMRSPETDKNMQIKAVPLPVDSKNQVLSENQQNEAKKEIEPIITSTVDVPKSMEIMKPIAAESSLPIKLPEDKKPPSDDKIQTAVAAATQPQPQTANETISCEKTDKTMAPKVQQKQGSKKDSTKQQTKQSSPPSTKTPTEAKKPEVAAKPKQVPAPKPQPPQTSTSPNPVPKTPQTPKSPTGSIKQEKPVAAPKPKATVTTPPKPQTTAPPTKATTSPAKKKSSSPPGTKKPTMDASANSNTREPVKKSQGEEIKGQPSLEVSKVQEGGEQPVGPSASTKKASSDPSPKAKGESGTKAQGSTDQTATIEKPKKVVEPKNSANKPATKVQGNADQAAKPRPDIASPKPKPAKSPAPKITQSSKPTPQKAPEDPNKKPPQ